MKDDTYNGWTNRETWAFQMFINDNQYLQDLWHERGQVLDVFELRDCLQDSLEHYHTMLLNNEPLPEDERLMIIDIGSYWRVNYYEIACAIKSDGDEIKKYERNQKAKKHKKKGGEAQ